MKAILLLFLTISTSFALEYEPLEHGLVEELSAEEMAKIMEWAENSKVALQDLLEFVEAVSGRDPKIALLEGGMAEIVSDSSQKRNELFLRYALNRGIHMSQLLNQEGGQTHDIKIARLRALEGSIHLASRFYQDDMDFLEKGEDPKLNRENFGREWFKLNEELARSVMNASAQYQLMQFGLQRLKVDLGHSAAKEQHTNNIGRIDKLFNTMGMLDLEKLSDQQLLEQMGVMMKTISSFSKISISVVGRPVYNDWLVFNRRRDSKRYKEELTSIMLSCRSLHYLSDQGKCIGNAMKAFNDDPAVKKVISSCGAVRDKTVRGRCFRAGIQGLLEKTSKGSYQKVLSECSAARFLEQGACIRVAIKAFNDDPVVKKMISSCGAIRDKTVRGRCFRAGIQGLLEKTPKSSYQKVLSECSSARLIEDKGACIRVAIKAFDSDPVIKKAISLCGLISEGVAQVRCFKDREYGSK